VMVIDPISMEPELIRGKGIQWPLYKLRYSRSIHNDASLLVEAQRSRSTKWLKVGGFFLFIVYSIEQVDSIPLFKLHAYNLLSASKRSLKVSSRRIVQTDAFSWHWRIWVPAKFTLTVKRK
jgi:hypothetical protein